jgi:divalent metal cation (Fe/Co/Zn/Cd) transporter
MFAWFVSLFTGSFFSGLFGTVNSLTAAISNEKIAAITATTDAERIHSQEKVAQMQQQRDVLIADAQHSKLDLYIRSIIAIGPAGYLLKIFLWDKVLAAWTHGTTDPIDTNLWQVVMVILGFYFVSATTTTVARIFASRK